MGFNSGFKGLIMDYTRNIAYQWSGCFWMKVGYLINISKESRKSLIPIKGPQFQWPRSLRRGYGAAPLPGLRVRISPVTWMFVSRECCTAVVGCCKYGNERSNSVIGEVFLITWTAIGFSTMTFLSGVSPYWLHKIIRKYNCKQTRCAGHVTLSSCFPMIRPPDNQRIQRWRNDYQLIPTHKP